MRRECLEGDGLNGRCLLRITLNRVRTGVELNIVWAHLELMGSYDACLFNQTLAGHLDRLTADGK